MDYSPIEYLTLLTEETYGVWCLSGLPTEGLPLATDSVRFAYPKPDHADKYREVTVDNVELRFNEYLGPRIAMEAWLSAEVLDWKVPTFDTETLSAVELFLNQKLTCIGKGSTSQAIATLLFRNVSRTQGSHVWEAEYIANELNKTLNQIRYELTQELPRQTYGEIRDSVRKALFLRFKIADLSMKEIAVCLGFQDEHYVKRKANKWFP